MGEMYVQEKKWVKSLFVKSIWVKSLCKKSFLGEKSLGEKYRWVKCIEESLGEKFGGK